MDGGLRTRKVIAAQQRYTEAKARDQNLNLFVPEAFIRGIRHIGYKSNLEALAELVDNSIQAYSERVDLLFNFASDGSAARPTQLAVVDDGHGMAPAMLRFAMMWGGTHRENDREGLGRFGYLEGEIQATLLTKVPYLKPKNRHVGISRRVSLRSHQPGLVFEGMRSDWIYRRGDQKVVTEARNYLCCSSSRGLEFSPGFLKNLEAKIFRASRIQN